MGNHLRAIALLAATSLAVALPGPAQSATPQLITGPYVSGWFGYWEPDSVVQALADKGRATVPEVNVFWWSFADADRPLCTYNRDSTCSTSGTAPWTNAHLDRQRRIIQGAGIPVLGSIVDGSRAGALSAYLASDTQRRAYAAQIVDWTLRAGLDGVDLDWEKFAFADGRDSWAETKPRWVEMVRILGQELRAKGLVLSATVPAGRFPFLSDGRPNPGTGYWVYAWDEIVDHVDRLRIMAYDYSYTDPGPIGPWPWANQVTASAIAQTNARKKVWLGVPQYARNWVRKSGVAYVTRGDCPASWIPASGRAGVPGMLSQSVAQAEAIAAREGITPTWNSTFGEYTYRYWIATDGTVDGTARQCTAEREVWFADTRSALAKANIVRDQRIAGLAVWEFGYVRESFYSRMAGKIAPPLALRAKFDDRIRKGESTRVTGRVLRGDKAVQGARVTVRWISSSGNTRDLGATRTKADGRYTLRVTPPRSGTLRIQAKSEGQQATIRRSITVRS
jgi:spore germination protein YaaH